MPFPVTTLSYELEYDLFDQALEKEKGIRVPVSHNRAAHRLRHRLHAARAVMREANRAVYKPGDPMYGASAYDIIVCRIRSDTEDQWWVYLEKNNVIPDGIEEITEENMP
jgi:hypothetical protein